MLVAGFLCGAYIYFTHDLPSPAELERYEPMVPCFASDAAGRVETKLHCRRPNFPVDIDHVPPHVANAFFAVEDVSFLNRDSAWDGRIRFTHYVAMGFLWRHRTHLGRGIRSDILERRIGETWGRKKVLWVFLNQVYLGEGCCGVGEAASHYFGKSVEQLSVGEAALLAGLSAGPSFYNPIRNPGKAEERKQQVLRVMADRGWLSAEEHQRAKAEPLSVVKH